MYLTSSLLVTYLMMARSRLPRLILPRTLNQVCTYLMETRKLEDKASAILNNRFLLYYGASCFSCFARAHKSDDLQNISRGGPLIDFKDFSASGTFSIPEFKRLVLKQV